MQDPYIAKIGVDAAENKPQEEASHASLPGAQLARMLEPFRGRSIMLDM